MKAKALAVIAAMLMTTACERMDASATTRTASAKHTVDITTKVETSPPTGGEKTFSLANAVPTRNARICTAAMTRVAAGRPMQMVNVDGNTAVVAIGADKLECLVDRNHVVWRRTGNGKREAWIDKNVQWRETDGRIAITGSKLMDRVLIHYRGAYLEWSPAIGQPATTGMSRDDMMTHLVSRGIDIDDAETALDIADETGTSVGDRAHGVNDNIRSVLSHNTAGVAKQIMDPAEIVQRYLVDRETLY